MLALFKFLVLDVDHRLLKRMNKVPPLLLMGSNYYSLWSRYKKNLSPLFTQTCLILFLLSITPLLSLEIDSLSTNGYEAEPFVQPIPQSFGLMFFQMLGILVIITIILYFFLYLVKKFNHKYKHKNEFLSFKIIENVYYSQKQGLSAVTFAGKLYLIGFSSQTVTLIDKIEDTQLIDQIHKDTYQRQKFPDYVAKFFIKEKGE